MNTRSLSRPLRLHRSPWRALADRWLESARHQLGRWLERRAQRREADLALAVERELRHQDSRTLADIGAAQGLIAQRRWQAEPAEQPQLDNTLRSQGW